MYNSIIMNNIEAIARREVQLRASEARARFPQVDPTNVFDPRADYLRRAGVVGEKIPTMVITHKEAEEDTARYLAGIDHRIVAEGGTVGASELSVRAGEELKAIRLKDLRRTRIVLDKPHALMTPQELLSVIEGCSAEEIKAIIISAGLLFRNE